MKNGLNKILFSTVFIILGLLAISYYISLGVRGKLSSPDGFGEINAEAVSNEAFAKTVTHDDLQEIYQLLLKDWCLSMCIPGRHNDQAPVDTSRSIYIIENQFIDKTFKIKPTTHPVVILTQAEYDGLGKTNIEIGRTFIDDVKYVGNYMDKSVTHDLSLTTPNSVVVSYSQNWIGGDGQNGYVVFTKEKGKWVSHGGFSRS